MTDTDDSSGATPVFASMADLKPFEIIPGIQMQAIAGDAAMVVFARIEPEAVLPLHHHSNEQITLVLEGVLHLTAAGETRTMRSGDMAVLRANIEHSAFAGPEGCRAIDVFTPPRAIYLQPNQE